MTTRHLTINDEPLDASAEHLSFALRAFRDMAELEKLSLLPNLRAASFCGSNLDDAGLEHVSRVATLQSLDLQDTRISDAGIACLARLPALSYLRLKDNRQLTNACIAQLLRLSALVELQIHETSIDQRGLDQLDRLPRLERICIDVWDDNYSYDALISLSTRMPRCTILAKGRGEFFEGKFDGAWPSNDCDEQPM